MSEPCVEAPVFADIVAARSRVYAAVPPSPFRRYPTLDEWLGCEAWVKHENHNPTGSFKIRGGVNLVAQLSADDRRRGLISASTGNHGQAIAYASRLHGVRCQIVVPRGNNPEKNAAMRGLGAEVVEHGRDYDEAREHVEALAVRDGWRYVHSANERHLIAGVGTYAIEIFEAAPDLDYLFVPVGGGSGASGCCIARTGAGAHAKIVGAQAAGADAFARSWRGPQRVRANDVHTFAEGLATRITFDLTFGILEAQLDDVVVLEEAELEEGVRAAIRLTHNLAEGAGAASIAAARKYAPALAGRKVGCVMTGGNIDTQTLRRILAGTPPHA